MIGDIDLLASSKQPAEVIEFFTSQPGIVKVLAKGDTKASVLLEGGIQSDLRVVSDAEYSSALMYFTGSKEHNIVMRQRAIDRGLRLNEYGLFRSKEETRDPKLLVKCRTEEEIFEKLGLHYIPPEMREDMGEIALAEKGPLPRLIEWTDLKGSLHNHSTWSDGHQRPEEIAKAMSELGLAYWGVTDHSKSSFQANGLDAARVRQQLKEIAAINAPLAKEGTDFRLLTGTEVDILKDGKLDFPNDLLAELDVVIASIHSSFSQTEAETTKRLIGAAQNPYVHILGHLTGRLLLEREPYKVDHRAVIDACAETGTWIELNAHPMRFDMDWRWWPYAKSKGVKCVINCDAHRFEHAGFLRLGAGIARKGWLTKEDVVNTLPLKALQKELGRNGRRRKRTLSRQNPSELNMQNQSQRLTRTQAGLIVVDIQERLLPAISEKERVVQNAVRLIQGAVILQVPVFATEQYRKGLGATVPEVAEAIPGFAPIEKLAFGACGAEGFVAGLKEKKVTQPILCGIEAHVCVTQTCLGLAGAGFRAIRGGGCGLLAHPGELPAGPGTHARGRRGHRLHRDGAL